MAASGQTITGAPLQAVNIESNLLCSFCGKRRARVNALVSGPNAKAQGAAPPTICDECLELCQEIMSDRP